MQLTVYNTKAQKAGRLTLPQEIFAAPVNPKLMAQAVRVYLSRQHQMTKKTKTRGQVSGSGRKIWRQKGTGRARHGDRYAPIFVGGGIAHGPKGVRPQPLKLSKKMRRQALFSALSSKANAKQIKIITGLNQLEPKTKVMVKLLTRLYQSEKASVSPTNQSALPKLTIVLAQLYDNIIRAGRNLPQVNIAQAKQLHTYQILDSQQLLFTKEAIKSLQEVYLQKTPVVPAKKV